jgi:aspartate ammonia-lyase
VNQVAFDVMGKDAAITTACEAGQLQLNPFEPLIFHLLAGSITQLASSCSTLRMRCVAGIWIDRELLRDRVAQSFAVVTALNPHIGYHAATALAREALQNGQGIADLVRERGLLGELDLAGLLSPGGLTSADGDV